MDRWIHYASVVAGVAGAIVLTVTAVERAHALTIISVVIYALGLVSMVSASALYNLAEPSPRKEMLRRLDHAAIYLMIAATYTPLTLVGIGGDWGVGIAAFVWLVASAGIALKLAFPRRFEGLSIALYLALGWTILIGLRHLIDTVPLPVILMFGAGGLLYSIGVIFHGWHSLPYHNAIWHGFVLFAAACQWVAMLGLVVRSA